MCIKKDYIKHGPTFHITASFKRSKPLDGLRCGGHQGRGDRNLKDRPRGDVQLLDAHDGLIQVVMDSNLKPLSSFQMKCVVEGFSILQLLYSVLIHQFLELKKWKH